MTEFRIEEVDKDGKPVQSKDAIFWLIKDGSKLHCSCPNLETARYAVQYFKEVHLLNVHLKDKALQKKLRIKELEFTVETELALKAIDKLKAYMELLEVSADTDASSGTTNKPTQERRVPPTGNLKG